MGLVNPSQSSPGETIEAADVNTPVNQLAAVINGEIENVNVKANAAIDGSKVTDKSGHTVQTVDALYDAVATGTTQIPTDDSVPQNTEGDQYMTVSITPKASSNKLYVEAKVFLSSSSASQHLTAALFKDSDANALAVSSEFMDTATAPLTVALHYSMAAGTTSAITFKVRGGIGAAGTTTFNGSAGTRRFGATTKSYIKVTEVAG